jgi:hypothetical protein
MPNTGRIRYRLVSVAPLPGVVRGALAGQLQRLDVVSGGLVSCLGVNYLRSYRKGREVFDRNRARWSSYVPQIADSETLVGSNKWVTHGLG